MDNDKLKEIIISKAPDAKFENNPQYLTAVIAAGKIRTLAKSLKESEDTYFDYLFCLSGVDLGDSLEVVYHITSTKYSHSVVLKVLTTDREKAAILTVSDIWATAEFHEREVFDLLGIKFLNHPDLRRIFLDESWVGYPLRKDYIDEENIIERG